MKRFKLKTADFVRCKLRHGIALMCFATAISIDTSGQFAIAVGPKAGVSITTFNGSDAEDVDKLGSWLGGMFINAQITPEFTLQPELLFSRRGADFTNNSMRRRIVINYFDVPVLAKYRPPVHDIVFPHILFGPNFSFRTNARYSSTDTETGNTIEMNDTDIRRSDVGAVVGAGIDIQTRNSGLLLTMDGRYGFGFNNIDRSDSSIAIKNAGWSFSFGVGFLLSR